MFHIKHFKLIYKNVLDLLSADNYSIYIYMNKAFYEPDADEKDYIYFRRSTDNVTPAHFHGNLELLYVATGSLKVVINGDEKLLTRGSIAVSSDFDAHYYETVGPSACYILLAGGKYMSRIYSLYGRKFVNFIDCSAYAEKLETLFASFLQEFKTSNELIKTAMVELIFGLLAQNCELTSQQQRNSEPMVEILRFMEKNYASSLSAGLVAESFGYSKTYFSALFNKYTGRNFRDYLNIIRLDAVEKEISASGVPVTKAALMCGFDSLNTYYRAKKRFQKT